MTELVDAATKKNLIYKQPCFSQLTDAEKEILTTLWAAQKIAEGTTIVTEGELVDSVYLIVSGKADVRHISLKNNVTQTKSVATLGPNDAIGLNDTGFYSLSGRRTATVVALTDMVVLYLSVAAFHGFALDNSHVKEIMHNYAENVLGIKT